MFFYLFACSFVCACWHACFRLECLSCLPDVFLLLAAAPHACSWFVSREAHMFIAPPRFPLPLDFLSLLGHHIIILNHQAAMEWQNADVMADE